MNRNEIYIATSGVVSLIQTGAILFDFALKFMDSIEKAGKMPGEDKKKWVLAKMREIINSNGYDVEEWIEKISKFIDDAIKSFNALKHLF